MDRVLDKSTSRSVFSSVLFACLACLALWQEGTFLHAGINGLSVAYFLFCFALTVASPKLGLIALAFALPLSSAGHVQVSAIFKVGLNAAHHPGLDLSAGFVSGVFVRKLTKRALFFERPYGFAWFAAVYSYMLFSVALSIVRNLWQSASVANLAGVVFNLSHLRELSWHEDFFPLKDLFSYSLAFAVFLAAYDIIRREERKREIIFVPVLLSSVLVSVFAFAQYLWQIGVTRNGFERGIDSVFPDLHSLAGFMLVPAIGSFFYARESRNVLVRALCIIAGIGGFITIVVSQSRFTFAIAILVAILLVLRSLHRLKSWKAYLGCSLMLAGLTAVAFFGFSTSAYIQSGYESLKNAVQTSSFDSINLALSYRPELYLSALRMFSAFPVLGLGQGQFNRSSRLPDFSHSQYLVQVGGENAHNYFLQTLAELGIVGFLLVTIFLSLPLFKEKGFSLTKVPLLAITAIFCGNIFAHSLLEREILIILALFIALYFAEASNAPWRPPVRRLRSMNLRALLTHPLGVFLALVIALGGKELIAGFGKNPYLFGARCFDTPKIEPDGWTSGVAMLEAPQGAQKIDLHYDVDGHKFLKYFPLYVHYEVKDKSGKVLKAEDVQANGNSNILFEAVPGQNVARMELHVSRCLVPKNVGTNGDTRHLGINIKTVTF